jgi:SAM-dependent methyltransferase
VGALTVEVAEGFGWEWNRFDELRPEYHQQFLDWIAPLGPDDFRGRVVLEGGCGKGRHARVVDGFGARELFALDLGSAVEAAYRNVGHLRSVHVIQGDIHHPPIKRCADLAYSVGVLHHLPEPEAGFRALVDKVRDGGRVAVWVYGQEGNEWIVRFVDPLRTRVTSRLPRWILSELARPVGYAFAAAAKTVYRPLATGGPLARAIWERLFYRDYLTYVAELPFRELHTIVFDQLVTPVAHYLPRAEVERWFRDPRLGEVALAPHNGNSWRANARVMHARSAAA